MRWKPRLREDLRRLMCNCSDEKVGQVAQRPPDPGVETLPAGVGYDLGRQAGPSTENKLLAYNTVRIAYIQPPKPTS